PDCTRSQIIVHKENGIMDSAREWLLAALVCLALAPVMAAQEVDRSPLSPVDAEPSCVFFDSCLPISTGPSSSGSQYSYCLARSAEGQKCQSVVTVYIKDSLCATGCNMCGSVTQSAACYCDQAKLETKGSCTYW
ncbi:MAG TPA: hypothetical protein VHG33_03615, partial [Woeseiaceae bacterium]|nr:hypothetical protein [Woeseiaceae bacterium]